MLDVSSNNLTGDVDLENLAKLTVLFDLDLSFNNLSLRFDNSMRYNVDFHFLGLSSCNIAEFPNFLKSLTNLNTLDLSRNRIRGTVPKWLWETGKDSLSYLNIADNFLTRMDPLQRNNLQVLDVRSNFLRGPIPILFSPSLSVFQASKNQLSGEISTSFCNMTFLMVLNLSYNNLSGKIPPCFGNTTGYLSVLDLLMNKFHGFIQFSFVKGNALRTLNLNGNQLNGFLPRNLLNCKELEVVDVGNNRIRGLFPQWLELLPKLQVLVLRSNNFHGRLSKNTSSLSFENLKIMDISNNNFTSHLPYFGNFTALADAHFDKLAYLEHEYDNYEKLYYQDSVVLVMKGFEYKLEKILTTLTTIDLSNNNFEGEIPDSITKLKALKGPNFSRNRLSGPVPPSLGDLTNLEWLDLSSNELAGRIPWRLTDLNQLYFLNLSDNKLEGPIPAGKQFDTFVSESYIGNPGLCGFPVSKSCSEDLEEDGREPDGEERITLDWKTAVMGYASGVVIGASIGYMLLYTGSFHYWVMKRFRRERRHLTVAPLGRRRRN